MKVYALIAISRQITDGQNLAEMLDSTDGTVGVFLTRREALEAMDAYTSIDTDYEREPYVHDIDGYPWHMSKVIPNSELGFEIEEFETGSLYLLGVFPRQEFKL